jgi:hypothetical protein
VKPVVYFIRPIGMAGPVKIGWSAHQAGRLSNLMAWSPFPLEIAAAIGGSRELERRFHARFRHLNTHREWFQASPEIADTIAAINAGCFDVETLPGPRALTSGTPKRPESIATQVISQRLSALAKRGIKAPPEVEAAGAHYGKTLAERERLNRIRAAFLLQHDARPIRGLAA